MTEAELLALMQRRVASTAVGPSAIRNMLPKGSLQPLRNYLARFDLAKLSKVSDAEFAQYLDKQTELFSEALKPSMPWGVARKCLNIFLRDAAYNFRLREHFKLQRIEPLLELPLDSHVAGSLHTLEAEGATLGAFKSVVGLDSKVNAAYQAVAAKVAARKGICRVHLDLEYWRRPKSD